MQGFVEMQCPHEVWGSAEEQSHWIVVTKRKVMSNCKIMLKCKVMPVAMLLSYAGMQSVGMRRKVMMNCSLRCKVTMDCRCAEKLYWIAWFWGVTFLWDAKLWWIAKFRCAEKLCWIAWFFKVPFFRWDAKIRELRYPAALKCCDELHEFFEGNVPMRCKVTLNLRCKDTWIAIFRCICWIVWIFWCAMFRWGTKLRWIAMTKRQITLNCKLHWVARYCEITLKLQGFGKVRCVDEAWGYGELRGFTEEQGYTTRDARLTVTLDCEVTLNCNIPQRRKITLNVRVILICLKASLGCSIAELRGAAELRAAMLNCTVTLNWNVVSRHKTTLKVRLIATLNSKVLS